MSQLKSRQKPKIHKMMKAWPIVFLLLPLSLFGQDPKREALDLWQRRDEQASLEQSLKKFEELHKASPAAQEPALYLLQGYFLLGDFHLEKEAQKIEFLEKAVKLGDEMLEQNLPYRDQLKAGKDLEQALTALDTSFVPAMFWTAAALGVLARVNGIMSSLKYKSKIVALIKRVEQLEPNYYFGSVPRFWGAYYSVIPGIAGKDLKKSQNYFKQALALGPEFLGTKVLKAETYLVEKDDEKGFRALLNDVLMDSQHDQHPVLGADNRMQKTKAKILLKQVDELF